jgi:hypothetical protein
MVRRIVDGGASSFEIAGPDGGVDALELLCIG